MGYFGVTGRAQLISLKGRNASRNGLVKSVVAVCLLKFPLLFLNLFCARLTYYDICFLSLLYFLIKGKRCVQCQLVAIHFNAKLEEELLKKLLVVQSSSHIDIV